MYSNQITGRTRALLERDTLMRWITRFLSALFVTGCLVAAGGCSTNPATGEKQLILVDQAQEIRIGQEASPKFLQGNGGTVPSQKLVGYVRDIGQKMAAQSELPNLPWEFHVIDSELVNAFALPGGKVFMSRGLLVKLTNEAQVAGVLGHEIGHVTARHIAQQMTTQILLRAGGTAVAMGTRHSDSVWADALGKASKTGSVLYLLKFSRDHENQSDELGVRYMTRLGYNPWGQVQILQLLKAVADEHGGGGVEWMRTHPLPESRVKRVANMVATLYPEFSPTGDGFFSDRFRVKVLDELAKLPKPKHPRQFNRKKGKGKSLR